MGWLRMRFQLDRRRFLMSSSATALATSFPDLFAARAEKTMSSSHPLKPALVNVKACVFDIFGTVVDWRTSVIAEATTWGKAKALNINWVEFTDRWRLGYKPTMDKERKAAIPWMNLDDVHRRIRESS